MDSYELVYSLREDKDNILSTLKSAIETSGGTITHQEKWGKKEFAYRIKKFTSGIFFVWQVLLNSSYVSELRKKLDLNDQVIRYLLIKN